VAQQLYCNEELRTVVITSFEHTASY